MSRRLRSLLALLLLVLSSQAAADHKDADKDRPDDGQGDEADGEADGDGSESWRGKDRSDDDQGKDDDDEGDDGGDDEDREDRRARNPRQGKGLDKERARPASTNDRAPDARVEILPTALPGRVQFSFLVASTAAADGMAFQATLPDTGNAWSLAGPSVPGCRLEGAEGRTLACSFLGLAAGDVRLVQATSPLGRAPPWELMAEGEVSLAGDRVPGNDRAAAGLGLLLA